MKYGEVKLANIDWLENEIKLSEVELESIEDSLSAVWWSIKKRLETLYEVKLTLIDAKPLLDNAFDAGHITGVLGVSKDIKMYSDSKNAFFDIEIFKQQ